MGLKGVLLGLFVGGRIGGALGAILAAAIGHFIEKAIDGAADEALNGHKGARRRGTHASRRERAEFAFAASASAMFAKMAKADGVVTKDEIAAVERAYQRLGFSPAARAYAINVFRRAKDDAHTIYEYAYDFTAASPSVEMRELLYGLLWDLAAADGVVSSEEDRMLRLLTQSLAVPVRLYTQYAARYSAGGRSRRSQQPRRSTDSLADAYATLGIPPSATFEEAKKAYREKAKQYHPDRLRAQGLPDGMIAKATERMAEINAAWDRIKAVQ